jgi:hypothetical protein
MKLEVHQHYTRLANTGLHGYPCMRILEFLHLIFKGKAGGFHD